MQEEYLAEKPNLPYPCVSYVMETQKVNYIKMGDSMGDDEEGDDNIESPIECKQISATYHIDSTSEIELYSNEVGSVHSYTINGKTFGPFETPIYHESEYVTFTEINNNGEISYIPRIEFAFPLENFTNNTIFTSDIELDSSYVLFCVLYNKVTNDINQCRTISFTIQEGSNNRTAYVDSMTLYMSFMNIQKTNYKCSVAFVKYDDIDNSSSPTKLTKIPEIKTIQKANLILNEDKIFNGKISYPYKWDEELVYDIIDTVNTEFEQIEHEGNKYYIPTFDCLLRNGEYNTATTWSTTSEVKENDYIIDFYVSSYGAFINLITISEMMSYGFIFSDDLKSFSCSQEMVDEYNTFDYIGYEGLAYIDAASVEGIINGTSNEALLPSFNTTISSKYVLLNPPTFEQDVELVVNITNDKSGVFGKEALTDVNIKNGLTTISSYAFNNCRKLTSITIPESITTIGSSAFLESNLSEIRFNGAISPIVPDIENYVTGDIVWYTSIFYQRSMPSISTSSFPSSGILYYPKGSDYSNVKAQLPSGWTSVEIEK